MFSSRTSQTPWLLKSGLLAFFLFVPSWCFGEALLDASGEFGLAPSSDARQFEFEYREPDKLVVLTANIQLTKGRLALRIDDPSGNDFVNIGAQTLQLKQALEMEGVGKYVLRLAPEGAVGSWSVRVTAEVDSLTTADKRAIGAIAISGFGMLLVGVAAVWFWRRRTGADWRWFAAGAAIWAVGVVLKFAWAIPLNGPILTAMEGTLPHNVYLPVGSVYIGTVTGVFEIGVTLIAALIWRKITHDASRGVAVGVGAGAFEAVLLGSAALVAVTVVLVASGAARQQLVAAMTSSATPLVWLVGPVERIITLLCHTSSRALVLMGVARGKWFWPFISGFALMTLIDSVAGYVHLGDLVGKLNFWIVYLVLAPAAIASIAIIVWCIRR
jgi:uncharacterized membrane protein YhfC